MGEYPGPINNKKVFKNIKSSYIIISSLLGDFFVDKYGGDNPVKININ